MERDQGDLGRDWDELFARDHSGLLLRRMEECVDGDFQTFKAKDGAFIRSHFFGKYPELLELVKDYSDEQLIHLHAAARSGEGLQRVQARVEHKGGRR